VAHITGAKTHAVPPKVIKGRDEGDGKHSGVLLDMKDSDVKGDESDTDFERY
jgi:hypothetical protein